MRVGISGMGRIGRLALRAALGAAERAEDDPRRGNRLDVVHLNEIKGGAAACAHLLEFDSVQGRWRGPRFAVEGEDAIRIGDRRLSFSAQFNPAEIPWGDMGVDLVLECTGKFLTPAVLEGHLRRGARRVIVAAPVKDPGVLPVFLYSQGWHYIGVASFLAAWTIGYGGVQALAPQVVRRSADGLSREVPEARLWAVVLAVIPVALALLLAVGGGPRPDIAVVIGLAVFGFAFAVNSSLHSYLILAYAGSEKAAEDVGYYYAANAAGRLLGILLSGVLTQYGGLQACLWGSAAMLAACAVFTIMLPAGAEARRLCRPSEAVLDILPNPQRGAFSKEDGEPVIDEQGRRVI